LAFYLDKYPQTELGNPDVFANNIASSAVQFSLREMITGLTNRLFI
jgi:hypothetical protein